MTRTTITTRKAKSMTSIQAQSAKQIRAELKAAFPATKFSVRARTASMMTAVDVEWTDGPPTEQIDAIVGKYEYGQFNGMTDSYEMTNSRDDLAQVKYTSTRRTATCYDDVKAQLAELSGQDDDMDLGSLTHQILGKTDLTSGYIGVRHTDVRSGSHADFYEIVTNDSPAETPSLCHYCHAPSDLDKCNTCQQRDADEQAANDEYRRREAARQAEAKTIAADIIEVSGDQRTIADFARLNKNDTLEQYASEIAAGDYDREVVKITHVATLTPAAYSAFCNQLLTDFDWLTGLGGTNSDYKSKYDGVENADINLCNDRDELDRWRAQAYRLGVLVTDGSRQLIADPQGYRYARYVGVLAAPVAITATEPAVDETALYAWL